MVKRLIPRRQQGVKDRGGERLLPDYADWQQDRSGVGWAAPHGDQQLITVPGVSVIEIYRRHFHDIRGQSHRSLDPSRIDAMIAVRMRVTGHSCDEITLALTHGPPRLQDRSEERDWPRYAARVVRYAFGSAGNREVARLVASRELWRKLESRFLQRLPQELSPSYN